MKKLLLFALLIIFSCSKDAGVAEPAPVITKYNLTVESSEGGSVDISGGTYNENSNVTVTATAAEGYAFSEWTTKCS